MNIFHSILKVKMISLSNNERCYIIKSLKTIITQADLFCSVPTAKNTENETNLENNPYFKKYAGKIDNLKESKLSEFEVRLRKLKEQPTICKPITEKEINRKPSASMKYRETHTKPKKLEDVLKIDLIENLTAGEIANLWKEYFTVKDGICAVVPNTSYEKIYPQSVEFPTFVYPLIRNSGYEFIVGQFSSHNCYFTSLANFQVHKEESPVCLSITYFPELKDTKGIILMRGEFDTTILNAAEAQFLANQVQLYYGSDDPKRKSLLWTFNREPHKFNHNDLITNLETF